MKEKDFKYLNRAYFAPFRAVNCPCGEITTQDVFYSFPEGEILTRENVKKRVALTVCKCKRVYFALLPEEVPPTPPLEETK